MSPPLVASELSLFLLLVVLHCPKEQKREQLVGTAGRLLVVRLQKEQSIRTVEKGNKQEEGGEKRGRKDVMGEAGREGLMSLDYSRQTCKGQ